LCKLRRKYLTLISNACQLLVAVKRKLLLRQLFFSGIVAACNKEVFFPFWHRASPELNSTQLGNNVTKDELRAELERQEQRYKDVYGGEVTTYAAQPEPERKPWRKRASLLDQAFAQEIQKIEQDLKAGEP
jgi:hypothetical protein